MDMINKIRRDLKEENEGREEVERERTHLQRSALKSKQLLSNSNCPGCQQEQVWEQQQMGDYRTGGPQTVPPEGHTCIVRLLDRPDQTMMNLHSRTGSAMSRGASQRSAMRVKNKQAQISQAKATPASKKDMNFYRKVSKYDLDRLSVDWKSLLRERER